MAAYTSVDEVASRFPTFKRTGPFMAVVSAARTSGVTTVTLASSPGAAVGSIAVLIGTVAAGATSFDGTFAVTAVSGDTFSYNQPGVANDSAGAAGLVSVAPFGKFSDGMIQLAINERAAFIEAVADSRNYQLGALPPGTAASAMQILKNLNKGAAQVLLGEAIQAQAGQTGTWDTLDRVRAEHVALLADFGNGKFDKLFLTIAGTKDSGPQAGGFAPSRPIFKREARY